MNTVHKFQNQILGIQKSSYKRSSGRKIDRSNCVITQELSPSFHHFMEKINDTLVHFHLLHESFKTTSVSGTCPWDLLYVSLGTVRS